MSVVIRRFCRDDADFALTLTAREGWDSTAPLFHVCLTHDPDGCFIAEIDGRPAGMITTTRYAESAWVGNLIVARNHRRKGVGAELMSHAMTWLKRNGVRTMRLEGDPLGIGIYRRLGFVDQFESLRFRKEPPHTTTGGEARRLDRSELPAAKELDLVGFADDRGRLLDMLHEISQGAYCVHANHWVDGFAIMLPTVAGLRFGPAVANNRAVAEQLLDSALAGFPDVPIVAGVPSVNATATGLFESRRFVRTRSSRRMLWGDTAAESDPQQLVAIANGAMG
jgi:GNAT superfamily N-acetyltransferase